MSVFKKEMTRRDAMGMILKTVAASAGMSVIDLRLFLSDGHAATLTNLKMLKVQLSGMNRQVFEAEFGRSTPLVSTGQTIPPNKLQPGLKPSQTVTPSQTVKPGQTMVPGAGMSPGVLQPGANMGMGCMTNMGAAPQGVPCINLSTCGANADGCPCLTGCTENVCSSQEFGDESGTGCQGNCSTNDCNDQNCSGLYSCSDNECTKQSCTNLRDCNPINHRNLVEILNTFRTDQFVQDLMRYFNITDTAQLANQVGNMIQQRRFITPAQIYQAPSVKSPTIMTPNKP
jgi:hypothetical protein